jgi:hypothetical protein
LTDTSSAPEQPHDTSNKAAKGGSQRQATLMHPTIALAIKPLPANRTSKEGR